jgi:hypothetical protein
MRSRGPLALRALVAAGAQVVALRGGSPAPLDAAIARVHRDCRGTVVPLAASAALRGAGDDRRAAALAREAAREEPLNFTAWAALSAALVRIDPRGAAAARERAARLSPLSVRAPRGAGR